MTPADLIPPGWGWHTSITVDDVAAQHEALAFTVSTRRGETTGGSKGRDLPATVVARIRAYTARGDTAKDIGRTLGISARTVTRHLRKAEAA